MTTTLDVRHQTTYQYARPVSFGEHRLMLRPRDSHDLRLLETTLEINPASTTRWIHDLFGNSITIAAFSEPASELTIESRFRMEHYPVDADELVLDESARQWPFEYDAEDLHDLRSAIASDPASDRGTLEQWIKGFRADGGRCDTMELLTAMNGAIRTTFNYVPRDDMGTQSAAMTLEKRSGSCRDFAMLLMEAARRLGIAARFVSGYLYDGARVNGFDPVVGAGATHAWAELFLPGAGWVELDPTNGLVGGQNLIRVAVARTPAQAVPIAGTFVGSADDYLGMNVEVVVSVAPTSGATSHQCGDTAAPPRGVHDGARPDESPS
jgi:transglutaminase-like putative cysteine protease